MACPFVSGIAALLLSDDVSLTPDEVMNQLQSFAEPGIVNDPGTGSENLLLQSPFPDTVGDCSNSHDDEDDMPISSASCIYNYFGLYFS